MTKEGRNGGGEGTVGGADKRLFTRSGPTKTKKRETCSWELLGALGRVLGCVDSTTASRFQGGLLTLFS